MATIVYKNAKAFVNDTQIDAALTDLTVEYKAELLDITTFGNDTRIHAGALYVTSISGKGYVDAAATATTDLDSMLWNMNGLDEGAAANGLPTVVTVFADGINEGTVTDMGFAMKGVVESLTLGGGVGIALPVTFAVQGRGVLA